MATRISKHRRGTHGTGTRLSLLVILVGLYVAVYLAVAGLLHVLTTPDAVAAAFVPDEATASAPGAPGWPARIALGGARRTDAPGPASARTDTDNDTRRRR